MLRKVMVSLAAVCCFAACGVRRRTYVVQEGTPAGELVIEWHPSCPPAAKDGLGARIDIPATGYVCTSTLQGDEWHESRYALRSRSGVRRLRLDEEVFNHSTFSFGKPGCSMERESFYYQPRGSKDGSSRDLEPLFRIRHSCDPTYHALPPAKSGV